MKFELTRPAVIAAIAYVIMAFVVMLPFGNIYVFDPTAPPPKQTFWYKVLILVIMLIPIALSIYSINCMMVGRCYIWSYVQAIIIAIWVVLFVTATLISSESQKEIVVL